MGALFGRVKTWVSTEDVTFDDLNAEFDNILDNLTAANVDDYSASVAQLQTTFDPGEVGTENLPTTLAEEIAALRSLIKEITGEDEWYESPTSSILGLAGAIGSGLTDNRLVSGRVFSGTQQPQFLTPEGTAAQVNLEAASTDFIFYVEGVEYTIDSDINITGLTTAPSSNNTCTVNDTVAADQEYTRYTGENGTEIPVDNMGSEISALIGQWAAFSHGSEHFIAYVESSTKLTKARRGFFFNASDAAVERDVYTNNDTITLLKLGWIFAQTAGTLTITYNNPTWSDDAPSSPSIGDYWFDYSESKWKVRGAASWSDADATLIGICAQDTSNCIAARSFEFFKSYESLNTCELIYNSTTEVQAKEQGSEVSVWGSTIKNDQNIHTWDITADRDSGVSEGASTVYWAYLTETGDTIISDIRPYDRTEDLKGWYHPHKSWRCLGEFFNDGSSDIEAVSVQSYFSRYERKNMTTVQTVATNIEIVPKIIRVDGSGGSFSKHLPSAALCAGQELIFLRTDDTIANQVTLDGFGAETISGFTTYPLCTQHELVKIISDGTNWFVTDHFAQTDWIDAGTVTIDATTTAPTKPDTVITDNWYYKRDGKDLLGRYEFRHADNTGAADGSGDYLFLAVPTGITIDTTYVTAFATVQGAGTWFADSVVGNGCFYDGASNGSFMVSVYDTTQVRLFGTNASSEFCLNSGSAAMANSNAIYSATYRLPIEEFRP